MKPCGKALRARQPPGNPHGADDNRGRGDGCRRASGRLVGAEWLRPPAVTHGFGDALVHARRLLCDNTPPRQKQIKQPRHTLMPLARDTSNTTTFPHVYLGLHCLRPKPCFSQPKCVAQRPQILLSAIPQQPPRLRILIDFRLNKFGLRSQQRRRDLTSAVTCCCFSLSPMNIGPLRHERPAIIFNYTSQQLLWFRCVSFAFLNCPSQIF